MRDDGASDELNDDCGAMCANGKASVEKERGEPTNALTLLIKMKNIAIKID